MILEIWRSFRSLPIWVQIWVVFILGPVNLATLAFLDMPSGMLIAALALLGMLFNVGIIVFERGLSLLMALPHLILWSPLVIVIGLLLASGQDLPDAYRVFLIVLIVVDIISLTFDYPDFVKWMRGQRKIAGAA